MRLRWHDAAVNLAAHPVAWPLARIVRRVGGVVRVPGFGTVVSDAAFAHDVLTCDDTFTKNGPRSLAATMTELLGPSALGNMDGEAHRALRSRLADVVAPSRAMDLLGACEPMIAQLRADLATGRTVDLVAWMRLLSGRVTFDMLGAAPAMCADADCIALVALGERLTSGLAFRRPSQARLRAAKADAAALAEQIRAGFDAADAPRTSFVRRLRDAGLSFDEARGVLSLLFLAGTLTTAAALPRLVALVVDGGHVAALRGRPDAITTAISEGLRYITPVPATIRIAQRDAEVQGRRIVRDERIIIITNNIARDAALFPDPDRFDPARAYDPRSKYLWYGAGPHFCLGFAVAQRQLQLVLGALVDIPGLLRVVHRRAARGVIIPAYARLDVCADRSPS
jgi:cytochrome P450